VYERTEHLNLIRHARFEFDTILGGTDALTGSVDRNVDAAAEDYEPCRGEETNDVFVVSVEGGNARDER